jgi:hypothetical protein
VSKRVAIPLALLLASCLVAGHASAYEQRIHELLSRQAYGATTVPVGGQASVHALRERVWHAGAESADPALRQRFLARYPTLAAFDAWALKQLMALNPDARVAGFDEDVPLPSGDAAAVYARASRLVDDDGRNRERFAHDRERRVEHDTWGRPLPADPATLEMGALTGLSSQAHAHYGLPKLAFSDDPDVLKRDPRRFAVPPTVHTFGAAFADTYSALAVMAAHLPDGERLALVQAGAAAHHIEDVANQIHTVQIGLYDFFVDAKIESIKEELRSVGGLARPRPDFVSIGLDIITNHHLLTEALFAKHLLAPGDPVAALTARAPSDAELDAALAAIPANCAPGFGNAITSALIERSSYEGPEVYRAIRAAAQRRFSRAGQHFSESDDPDAALVPGADLSRFWALEAAGVRRSQQALHAWWQRFDACRAADAATVTAIGERLLRDRLDALDEADARARAYHPQPPAVNQRNYAILVGYLLTLSLVIAVVLLFRRARRRRR